MPVLPCRLWLPVEAAEWVMSRRSRPGGLQGSVLTPSVAVPATRTVEKVASTAMAGFRSVLRLGLAVAGSMTDGAPLQTVTCVETGSQRSLAALSTEQFTLPVASEVVAGRRPPAVAEVGTVVAEQGQPRKTAAAAAEVSCIQP